jgi:hypothetical protein
VPGAFDPTAFDPAAFDTGAPPVLVPLPFAALFGAGSLAASPPARPRFRQLWLTRRRPR